jgi:probable DNA repair protein
LLELPEDLLAHLQQRGTLVVPTLQRAAAARLAYSAAQLAAGRRVWSSPDILPWRAWLERELDAARARGTSVPRRLSGAQEWLLWRRALSEAAADSGLLRPDSLVDDVRTAARLLADYGVRLRSAESAESALLMRAMASFRQRCRELDAISPTEWAECAPLLPAPGATLLAGFDELGPARRRWLEDAGIRLWEAPAAVAPKPEVVSCEDAAAEALAAAQWCAERLQRDGRARLLLIVPQLPARRALWERALAQRLEGASMLAPRAAEEPPFVIEGGQPLTVLGLAATALRLIALATQSAEFEQLSAVLRSPYVGLDRTARLRLDVWLREQNTPSAEPATLYALLDAAATELGAEAARTLKGLAETLQAVGREVGGLASGATWARAFAQLLPRCGWPGPELHSGEQQTRMRFDELLGEFATLDAGPLSQRQAYELLHALALRSFFEPASNDVAVTVTASLDDPIVRYDGIWVAGLTAAVLPAAARTDALLPLSLQRQARMPGTDPSAEPRRALRLLRHWQMASAQCVLSWPRSAEDLPCQMSPLLQEAADAGPGEAASRRDLGAGPELPLEAWLTARAPVLERWSDRAGPSWPPGRALRGGTRLLELQANCPFRAFAELRLGVRPLPTPAPGIDARLRGQLVHQALELFWGALQDSRTLHSYGEAELQALASQCAAQALLEALGARRERLDPVLLERERQRTEALLLRVSEWDRTRPPFSTQALEATQQWALGGTQLRVRLDRVDRLEDGRLVVIDYKSGQHAPFDAHAERLTQPQLPAYALSVGDEVAAVVALYVGREAVSVSGLADRAERVSRIRGVAGGDEGWARLRAQWRSRLQQLIAEALAGHAAVAPQPNACATCHLPMLCRIDAPQATPEPAELAEAALES